MADEGAKVSGGGGRPVLFDTSVAHVARVYDYWLGGKDNFAADRAAGTTSFPASLSPRPCVPALWCGSYRGWLRQFLDIPGIPRQITPSVAQSVPPSSRNPAGATEYIDADLNDPQKILDGAAGCWISAVRSL